MSPHICSTTGIVGGDNFIENISKKIIQKDGKSEKDLKVSDEIVKFLGTIENEYKKIIEKNNIGNQLICRIKNS